MQITGKTKFSLFAGSRRYHIVPGSRDASHQRITIHGKHNTVRNPADQYWSGRSETYCTGKDNYRILATNILIMWVEREQNYYNGNGIRYYVEF